MAKVDCPNCGSDQWKALSLIHAEGTQSVVTTTASTGGGVGIGTGGIGVGLGKSASTTSGMVQSKLSAKAAPPIRPDNGWTVLAAVLAAPGVLFLLAGIHAIGVPLIFLALLFGTIAAARSSAVAEGQAEYENEKKAWDKRRMCLRCGSFYDPIEDSNNT